MNQSDLMYDLMKHEQAKNPVKLVILPGAEYDEILPERELFEPDHPLVVVLGTLKYRGKGLWVVEANGRENGAVVAQFSTAQVVKKIEKPVMAGMPPEVHLFVVYV